MPPIESDTPEQSYTLLCKIRQGHFLTHQNPQASPLSLDHKQALQTKEKHEVEDEEEEKGNIPGKYLQGRNELNNNRLSEPIEESQKSSAEWSLRSDAQMLSGWSRNEEKSATMKGGRGLTPYLWDEIPRNPKQQGTQPHFTRSDKPPKSNSNTRNDMPPSSDPKDDSSP